MEWNYFQIEIENAHIWAQGEYGFRCYLFCLGPSFAFILQEGSWNINWATHTDILGGLKANTWGK